MKESKHKANLIKLLKYKPIFLQPIESPSTGLGIPDLFYKTPTVEGWIEIKVIHEFPIRESTLVRVPFRPGQLNWIKAYRNYNGNAFLFCYIENSLFIYKNKEIQKIYTQSEFIQKTCYSKLIVDIDSEHILDVLNNNYRVINLNQQLLQKGCI